MKRERVLQVFAGLLGLAYLGTTDPLYTDFVAFQVASGNPQRMRADVSQLVYRARAISTLSVPLSTSITWERTPLSRPETGLLIPSDYNS